MEFFPFIRGDSTKTAVERQEDGEDGDGDHGFGLLQLGGTAPETWEAGPLSRLCGLFVALKCPLSLSASVLLLYDKEEGEGS